MASIPPNVENTEISDFLKLGQDCEQIAITAYQTCPDMQLMYPGAHACCSKQPACCSKQPAIQKWTRYSFRALAKSVNPIGA